MNDAPVCPKCGTPMASVRVIPRLGGLPELRTYECKTCRVVFTEAVTGPEAVAERACVLNFETSLDTVRQ